MASEVGDRMGDATRTNIQQLSINGIYIPADKSNKSKIKLKSVIANVSVGKCEPCEPKVFKETRTFFDVDSENTFLSLCAIGHKSVLDLTQPLNPESWKDVKYISQATHLWYHQQICRKPTESLFTLSEKALDHLRRIESKHNLSNPSIITVDKHAKIEVFDFFEEFGSHVSLGPYTVGGRCTTKISSSVSNKENHLKKTLYGDYYKVSKYTNSGEIESFLTGQRVETTGTCPESEVGSHVELFREFIPSTANTTVMDWKENLRQSYLVVEYNLSFENLRPVWEIVRDNKHNFPHSYEKLAHLLETLWHMVEDLKIPQHIQGCVEATALRSDTNDDGTISVFWTFFRAINSLDYRGRKPVKLLQDHPKTPEKTPTTRSGSIFDTAIGNKTKTKKEIIISQMDVTAAILHCCDPFLTQDILWKMSECRLAVPLLLPDLCDKSKVEFQLWGLRKIYKSWKPSSSKFPIEKSVVDYPLAIVSFIRFGKISISKSRLLNKIMGTLQGNGHHPFFVDCDAELPCATWSKGTVEAAWFLPEGMLSEDDHNAIPDAVTFLNLRGNALEFQKQKDFACQASDVVVIMVEEENFTEHRHDIETISKTMAKHLVCIVSSRNPENSGNTIRENNVSIIFGKEFLDDIGADICKELKLILWPNDYGDPKDGTSRFKSLHCESMAKLCQKLEIHIDEDNEMCRAGKKKANDIIASVRNSRMNYKTTYLPLQEEHWKKWADLDKKWSRGYNRTCQGVEHFRDDLKKQMHKVRKQQFAIKPNGDIVQFTEALKHRSHSSRYFIAWLDFHLNDLSEEKLGPLRKRLRSIQDRSRAINADISRMRNTGEEDKEELNRLEEEDETLFKEAKELAEKIDKESLGKEHFVREIGQRFEAYVELETEGSDVDKGTRTSEDIVALPGIAAQMLIDGYPLEVLDGDVGRVPVHWVQAVFDSLIKKLGNLNVCAISVLGVQSSGKSTLLNCMFGVRFAVSAGRCTRGVFIQLLKVDHSLRREIDLGCDYVIVIDTEGLKAPERTSEFRHDNELATFALCLADLTVINIAGQTVGKDMTDVLQIAGHAFIRMKEVRIRSSCRIIQQFVADLSAVDKNAACTQAILASLDVAVAAAAKDEGCCNLYSRFSDVFNLNRDDNMQYIPSLWQGSMAPPNHRYSEKVSLLKTKLLCDLKGSCRPLRNFSEKLTNIWRAVKEENFIFSFKNCVTALHYKTFQHQYGRWVSEMRQRIMERESVARRTLKEENRDSVPTKKQELLDDLDELVVKESKEVEGLILQYLQDNVRDDDDQLHRFEAEFLHDLELTREHFKLDARETLNRVQANIEKLNNVDNLLPTCRNQIREKARKEALELREKHKDADSIHIAISVDEMKRKFERLWNSWIDEVCKQHPPKFVVEEEVKREVFSYVYEVNEKRDVHTRLVDRLMKKTANLSNRLRGRSSVDTNSITSGIITSAIQLLKSEIEDDLAYEPAIIKELIDTTVTQLTKPYDGVSLDQETKLKVIQDVCEKAVPIIHKGRCDYNEKFSLRQLLTNEKSNLWKDFQALCSDAFQDVRAAENLVMLISQKIAGVVKDNLGHIIFKEMQRECPFVASKFAFFGQVLEDMAIKDDFQNYYRFIWDLKPFLSEWTHKKIAEFCVSASGNSESKSLVQGLVCDEVGRIVSKLLREFPACKTSPTNETDSTISSYSEWLTSFFQGIRRSEIEIHISQNDENFIRMFGVKNLQFVGDTVKGRIENDMTENVEAILKTPGLKQVKEAERMLKSLPSKPQEEINKHVRGCTEQCPLCYAPCDNMTSEHDLHRVELHRPEGVIGGASRSNKRLLCNICTSSVTTNDVYWDGTKEFKYKEYQKEFPNWVIQEVRDQSPIKYWQWVMNNYNEDFAKLYGRNEASLPTGWVHITKDQALRDLRQAYTLKHQ